MCQSLYYYRVQIVNNKTSPESLDYGFSSSFMFLIWAVGGGFIMYLMLSNYLPVLMKQEYGKPIDSLDDVVGRAEFTCCVLLTLLYCLL